MSTKPGFFNEFFNMSNSEIFKCSLFSLKMGLFICLLLIVISCSMSCINLLFFDVPNTSKKINDYEYKDFSCDDDDNNSYLENFKYTGPIDEKQIAKNSFSVYEMTDLTPISDAVLTGQARRVLQNDDGETTVFFEVDAHLYVINGSPFANDTSLISVPMITVVPGTPMNSALPSTSPTNIPPATPQDYLVYLSHKNGDRYKVGSLTKDNDGIYKLRVHTTDPKLVNHIYDFNKVSIVFTDYKNEQEILSGYLDKLNK